MGPEQVGRFKKARQFDDHRMAYEYFYAEKDSYRPSKNLVTNEVERCVIRLDIDKEKVGKNGNRALLHIFPHLPNGTDYGRNKIEKGSSLRPLELISHDEVEFNIESKTFFLHGKKKDPKKIFEKLFRQHMKPTRIYLGAMTRFREKFWLGFAEKFESIATRMLTLKSHFDGISLKDEKDLNLYSAKPIEKSDFKPDKTGLIKLPALPDCTKLTALILVLFSLTYSLLVYNFAYPRKDFYLALYPMLLILFYLLLEWVFPWIVVASLNWVIHRKDKIFRMEFRL